MSIAALVAMSSLAHAQGFTADYTLALGADSNGAGLSLRAGRSWFGQVQLAQGPGSTFLPAVTHEWMNVGGGYRWANGRALSLQLSRGRGLGLALNYDWPHYFMRLSYDRSLTLVPQDSVRFSAGIRF